MTEREPDLPDSSGSTEGASGGSLGGASHADLKRGYSNASDEPDEGMTDVFRMPPEPGHGFLDRPQGWER